MIVTGDSKDSVFYQPVDGQGNKLQYIKEFNTETKEAYVYIMNMTDIADYAKYKPEYLETQQGEIQIAKMIMHDVKIIDIRTGEEVK